MPCESLSVGINKSPQAWWHLLAARHSQSSSPGEEDLKDEVSRHIKVPAEPAAILRCQGSPASRATCGQAVFSVAALG